MLKYIIAVTQTALPPMLVLGLFLSFAAMRHRPGIRRYLWSGAALGFVLSLVLVILKKNTGFVVREYVNLAILLPTLLAELALAIFVVFPGRERETPRADLLFRLTAFLAMTLWLFFSLPDLMFYPFDFHVGMGDIFNTRYASKVFGYALGLIAAGAALLILLALNEHLSAWAKRAAFLASLTVFAADQILSLLQIGLGRGLMPRNPFLVRLTIDMLNRREWFLFALAGIGAICALAAFLRNRGRDFSAANPALSRKLRSIALKQKHRAAFFVSLMLAAVLAVTLGAAYENQVVELDPPLEIAADAGTISIALEKIDDGILHRFKHMTADGTEVRYIVIKKNETAFGVGLDACDICGASGYFERNGQVVCILCDVVMNKATIGFPGGCNPVPLMYRVENGAMRIEISALEKSAWRFKD